MPSTVYFLPDKARPRPILADAINRKHLIVHHEVHAGLEHARCEQALGKILQPVRTFEPERRHGAREDHRDLEAWEILFQQQPRLDHRVGAVRDDHRRGTFQLLPDNFQHALPIGGGHLQAINVHHADGLDARVGQPQQAEVAVNLVVQVLHRPGLLGIHLLDGATRRDDVSGLHEILVPVGELPQDEAILTRPSGPPEGVQITARAEAWEPNRSANWRGVANTSPSRAAKWFNSCAARCKLFLCSSMSSSSATSPSGRRTFSRLWPASPTPSFGASSSGSAAAASS